MAPKAFSVLFWPLTTLALFLELESEDAGAIDVVAVEALEMKVVAGLGNVPEDDDGIVLVVKIEGESPVSDKVLPGRADDAVKDESGDEVVPEKALVVADAI